VKRGAPKYLTLCFLYLNIQSVAKRSEANPCKAKKAERSKAKELSEAKQKAERSEANPCGAASFAKPR